jgi:hypothetical protein
MYDQSPWKTLQMADIFDDDEHFKRKARRSVEDTDGIDGDIDSPISKTPPKTSVEGIILPSFNLGTVDEGEGFSRESIISEFQVVGDSNPPSRRTSVLSAFSVGGTRIPKHYSVALEILTTEQTYCKGLWLIEKIRNEVSSSHKGSPILPDEGVKEVFLNIAQIYVLNRGLLKDLDERMKTWEEKPIIGDLMSQYAHFFKIYSDYSALFDQAQCAYAKWLDKKKSFADLIKKTEASAVCGGLPFSSYFLTPIQRIPRYKLLLKEYLKYLPQDSPDRENAQKALATISDTAEHMNDRIKDLKKQAKVVEVARKLDGNYDIVAPGREFMGRGPVAVSDSKGGHKIKQGVLFLFSDILVLTKMSSGGRYKVKHVLKLHDMHVRPLQSAVFKHAFQVTASDQGKVFQFSAKSDPDRDRWVDVLKETISRNDKKRDTLQLDGELTIVKDPHIKSVVETMSVSPTLLRKKSVRRKFSMRRKAIRKSQLDSDEVDSGNSSDVSLELFCGDRRSADLDSISTISGHGFVPGLDNKLSSFMRQKGLKSDDNFWLERWYVLNSHSLLCFSSPEDAEPVGAISLTGYCASLPDPSDNIKDPHVLKLSHATKRHFFFQLPGDFEFHKWFSALQELCECDVNKYGFDD